MSSPVKTAHLHIIYNICIGQTYRPLHKRTDEHERVLLLFCEQLAHRIADKRKDNYSAVANYIRTKIRIALLKRVRGKQKKDSSMPTSAVALGLIPEKVSYEAY